MKNKEYYKSFHLSGFTYYEGPLLMAKLQIGKKLKLKAEPENRYDENAVAIYFKKHKIGFVPKEKNYSISKLLKQGHEPFYVAIQQIDQNEHPERQIRVAVYIKQSENKKQKETKEISKAIENVSWLWEGENDEKLIALKEAIESFFEDKNKE
ncbi:MAG: HIRAN domain-containing protein [Chitinophagales bacterium]